MEELEFQRFVQICIRPVKVYFLVFPADGGHPRKRIIPGEFLYRLGNEHAFPYLEVPVRGAE